MASRGRTRLTVGLLRRVCVCCSPRKTTDVGHRRRARDSCAHQHWSLGVPVASLLENRRVAAGYSSIFLFVSSWGSSATMDACECYQYMGCIVPCFMGFVFLYVVVDAPMNHACVHYIRQYSLSENEHVVSPPRGLVFAFGQGESP